MAGQEVGELPRPSSTPTLPPLAGRGSPILNDANAKAAKAAAARQNRGRRTDAGRQAFLNGLLNEDLQKVAQWHGSRPHHEQKRFLRSVDTLYKAFQQQDGPSPSKAVRAEAAAQAQAQIVAKEVAAEAAAAVAAEEDPLVGPPRSPRQLVMSASEPALVPNAPIEVFEQKRRQARRGADEDPNTLLQWLDGQSVTTASTGTTGVTHHTRFSELTRTSASGSFCSEPGTMHQSQFRNHKRAFAINKKNWQAVDQSLEGCLKGGIPNIGFPDAERMVTNFNDFFGARPVGESGHAKSYESVLNPDNHQFVQQFLETAQPEQKEQFAGMVRSLEYLRRSRARETTSVQREELDLQENSRLWRPPKQKPVFDPSQVNLSTVPLGTIQQTWPFKTQDLAAQEALVSAPQAPPSPSVSDLGSLPLTRLSTPAIP